MAAEQIELPRMLLVNRCFVVRPSDKRLLVIKRSPTDSHNPNMWEVPGGKMDLGQELFDAAEREVLEETGLVTKLPHHPFVFPVSYIITSGKYSGCMYLTLYHVTELVGGVLKLSGEHADSSWVTYDEMMSYEITLSVRKAAIYFKNQLS